MSISTSSHARSILKVLNRYPRAFKLLQQKRRECGRDAIDILRRFGDPRNWVTYPRGTFDRRDQHGGQTLSHIRRCHLEHIETGRVINVRSIVLFCRKAGFEGNTQFHISPVLDGTRLSYKGWYLPSTLRQSLALRDIYGNETKTTFKEAVTKHGLATGSVWRMIAKNRDGLSGKLVRADMPLTSMAPNPLTTTKVVFRRAGKAYSGRTVSEAAAKAGYGSNNLAFYQLAYGMRSEYKGYRFAGAVTERKRVLDI